MKVRALAFDVFGTIVDWRSGIADAFRAGGVPGDQHELADAWRARYWPILGQVNEGARPWANFDEHHRMTLDDLLSERGVDLTAEERRRLVGSWHRLDPWSDARTGLEALRRQHVTATLSNGHLALLVDLARHADLRFDCVLSAELAHAYKPAPEVYATAARLLGLEPDEVMMVAAHPLDLRGAREAGLQTAFIDRPLEYGPGSAVREDPEAALSVSDLNELAERLSG
ncbi:MAG TPA: haloacid dehalogenase type II [Solirubrobacteraceae bacterium]|nr:haloacid dehalogenase type II [Solirubrobacteraceae bacterium]